MLIAKRVELSNDMAVLISVTLIPYYLLSIFGRYGFDDGIFKVIDLCQYWSVIG